MNSNEPLVSVIMPAYNAARFIGRSIESVMKQSYENWELLIIDDASSDETYEIARSYQAKDSRIYVQQNTMNSGVSVTRNRGIQNARGTYIALLDSDDLWEADKLTKQIRLLKETGARLSYTAYDYINEDDVKIHEAAPVSEETNFETMLRRNEIGCLTAVVEAFLMKAHPFRSDVQHEDYALWMELLETGIKTCGCREVLAHYRLLETARNHSKVKAARERWKIYRQVLALPLGKSISAFVSYFLDGMKKYH